MSPALDARCRDGFVLLDAATRRHDTALTVLGVAGAPSLSARALIREALTDIPPLLEIARDGLLARQLLNDHAGWQRRLEMVRMLHGPEERAGGLIVCLECSRPFEPAVWPCRTLRYLDGPA